MIKPVYVYGSPVLRKVSTEITSDYPNLKELIESMFETMDGSEGVGLAAPQIGLSIRLFVIDTALFGEDHPEVKGFKKVFINPKIIERSEVQNIYNEGCLSIPSLREDVERPESVTIKYFDENFVEHEEFYDGIIARVIQHEYDHLEGILFTDRVSPIRRQLLKSKLNAIVKGKFNVSYKVKIA
ncbi:MAG: peptide deformylase [Tenuifilaceae bacterium]|jgi:peptide deformylase|nr:peptide deformylase [Bacteroidales bacterium]MDI9516151.1 peptide deformylase [Bacteroidota bacterium]NLH55583.1 peptide deformylase [Rikenellaceae bacterium]OQC61244.1 MAG: Peptide deformylase [Bacteroidetes bacterium ADurb.Bin008]HNV81753.1 peptide deformylase [Tenuifilaceae bacterium]